MNASRAVKVRYLHNPQDGLPGTSGMPPRLWDDYPAGYQFQDGTPGVSSWLDVVLMPNSNAPGEYICYYCKVSHTKAASRKPANGASNTWWGMMDGSFSLLATKILLAQQAFVRNLIAQYILMTDDAGNEIFAAVDGEVRCNKGTFRNVDVSGRITAGDASGRHILLDPDDKAIRIFDKDGNECATLDGSAYTSANILPAAGLNMTINPTGKQTLTVNASATDEIISASKYATNQTALISSAGQIKVTLNASLSMTVPPSGSASGSPSDQEKPQRQAEGNLYCIVTTYDANNKAIRTSRTLVFSVCPMYDTGGSQTGLTAGGDRTFTVSVPPGKHRISFTLEAAGGSATATYTLSLAQMVQDFFLARYFANGLALTRNTLNYLLALYENSTMKLMLGGDFYIDKVKQPKVVYAARVTDTSNDANTACTTKQFVNISSVTATKQSTVGLYRFVFPAAYGLTADNTLVQITGYGIVPGSNNYPVKGTVRSMSVSSGVMTLDVWISDDDSPNYGGFYIEVKKC